MARQSIVSPRAVFHNDAARFPAAEIWYNTKVGLPAVDPGADRSRGLHPGLEAVAGRTWSTIVRGFGQGGPTFVKIAVFTDSYRPYVSGVVRSIDTFGAQLLALGHEVYVFGPRYYGNSGTEDPASPRGEAWPNLRHKLQWPWQTDDGADVGTDVETEENGEHDAFDGESPDDELILPDGRAAATKVYRFWSIPVPMYRGFTAPVPISARADELLEELGIDVIHSHTPFAMGTLGAVLAKKRGLPLVFTHHTMYHEYVHYLPGVRTVLRQMMLRYVGSYCRKADLVIAPTPHIRDFIVDEYGIPPNDAVAIATGIDMADFAHGDGAGVRQRLGIPDEHRVLSFVGRLGLEKNVGFLLQMLARVHRVRSDVHLVLVGDGPERQSLVQKAEELGVADKLHFTGTVSKTEVNDVFHASDLFVIASTSETQGLATLEAMATGLPVVGVDAPGTKDMVEHGRQGFLTPEDTAVFADAVVRLLGDEGTYSEFVGAARNRAETFTAHNMALQLVDVYGRVLGRPGHGMPGRDSAIAME